MANSSAYVMSGCLKFFKASWMFIKNHESDLDDMLGVDFLSREKDEYLNNLVSLLLSNWNPQKNSQLPANQGLEEVLEAVASFPFPRSINNDNLGTLLWLYPHSFTLC
jgi:hypothetical protein